MPRKSNADWLEEKLKKLIELAEKIKDGGKTTNYNDFTALKLIAIHFYSEIFSRIVFSQKTKQWYDGAVYVDFFAGTGLVRMKGSTHDDYLPGSPICAASVQPGFDYIICVESGQENCKKLETRLAKMMHKDKFDVIHGDCNEKISEIIELINKRFVKPIILAFIDPEGLEIKFTTLKKLSDNFTNCDFIVNVNSQGVIRVRGKYDKGISNVRERMEEFYDSNAHDILYDLASGMTPEEKYARQIREILGKSVGNIIKIREKGERVAYYLLGYTRKTVGGSQYGKAFCDLERRLSWADKQTVRNMIEVIHNRQHGLRDYI